MRLLIIRHHDEDHAGLLGDAFAEEGAEIATYLYPSNPLPDAARYDHVVVLGAKWSVNEMGEAGHHVAEEVAWLREVERRGQPVLGICFGSQLLTVAGGGEVEACPRPEIGWTRIESVADVPPLLEEGPWFQFHSDRCLLPSDARLLARNEAGVQAFMRGRSLGVQFHPEVDAAQLSDWLDAGAREDVIRAGLDPDVLLEETVSEERGAAERARRFVASYLAVIG